MKNDVTSCPRVVIRVQSRGQKFRGAALFDRDGTLNEDVGYLYRAEDFHWVQGAIEALHFCHAQGFLTAVLTNQSGIARGYYTEDDVLKLHAWMQADLTKHGTYLDALYFCPHHPEAQDSRYRLDCPARKPAPLMVTKVLDDFSIPCEKAFLIGDRTRDIEAAERAGVRGFLYAGGSLLMTTQEAFRILERFANDT